MKKTVCIHTTYVNVCGIDRESDTYTDQLTYLLLQDFLVELTLLIRLLLQLHYYGTRDKYYVVVNKNFFSYNSIADAVDAEIRSHAASIECIIVRSDFELFILSLTTNRLFVSVS